MLSAGQAPPETESAAAGRHGLRSADVRSTARHPDVARPDPDQGRGRTTRTGILIPATAEMAKRLVWGEVAGVGQHVRSVKLGERVLFSPEDQYEVEVGGETYLVLRERDLQAVASERTRGGTGLYL